MPKISIALATYNGEQYVKEQLDSIRDQTFSDFELVICDDSSKDSTREILAEYQQKDSRIKIYHNKTNLGFKKNFEKLISLCSGDYIAFCDQDDIWHKNHLEILLNEIGSNDCVGANSSFVDSNGIDLQTSMTQYLLIQSVPTNNTEIYNHEVFGNMIQGTASLFSRDLITNVLPLPEDIKFHDYWIALNACIRNGCKYVNIPILDYRRHLGNVTEYEKFSFFKTIRKINLLSKNRPEYYKDNICMLRHLQKKEMSKTHRIILSKALKFYENLASNKQRIQSLLFYIVNYKKITRTNYSHILAFGFRVLSVAIFGIRY